MSFPETRLTLIQRLASGGSAEDWQGFLRDYWGPVCRFALRSGAGQLSDAEDVASQTFEVLWESRLLVRWIANRTAQTAEPAVQRHPEDPRQPPAGAGGPGTIGPRRSRPMGPARDGQDEQSEIFYAAWVEDLLSQTLESVAAAYYREAARETRAGPLQPVSARG